MDKEARTSSGCLRGGGAEPPDACLLWGGGHSLGSLCYLCLHFPSSGNLHSTLHCIALSQTKRLRKELKYILIHNNTLQSFVWSSIAFNIHVSHFGFSTKTTRAFLASETTEKWRFQRYRNRCLILIFCKTTN